MPNSKLKQLRGLQGVHKMLLTYGSNKSVPNTVLLAGQTYIVKRKVRTDELQLDKWLQNMPAATSLQKRKTTERKTCYNGTIERKESGDGMSILESKDLCKTYGSGESEVRALDHVSIRVGDGEFISIVGTSGSGKSTLLNMLGGLDRPDSGSVTISGRDIFSMKDEELTIFRRRNIGFVFQNYNLVPVLNVYENIVLSIELDGSEADKEYVGKIIAKTDINFMPASRDMEGDYTYGD